MASVPYTKEDKEILIQILKRYPIVKEKKSDSTTIKRKNYAWSKITDEFNASQTSEKRTTLQLKRCWDKIKRKRKEDLLNKRRQRIIPSGEESVSVNNEMSKEELTVSHLSEYEHVENGVNTIKTEDPVITENHLENNVEKEDLRDLMNEQLENVKLERHLLLEVHEFRKETEMARRDEANLKREIAQVELLIKQQQLKQEELRTEQLKRSFENY